MFKQLLFFTLLSIVCSVCGYCQKQGDLNEMYAAEFRKTDKELNKIYLQLLNTYKDDTAFIKNLKVSQRLWVQFRDAEMLVKYPNREYGHYGSVFPMCWSIYLTDLTSARVATLKKWIVGEEEGDVCAGSVPIKR